MLGILFKKQMSELNQSFFQDRKKGKRRSAVSTAALVLLYLSLLVCLGGIFFYVGKVLCQPLLQAGIGWLYFTIMGMIALALGIFGSIFNTFASLYQAKDNDLLLSLPIPIRAILLVRLSGVYVMGLLYGSIVTIPAIIVYVMTAGAGAVLGGIVWLFLISLCNLILSCILGWVVAKINSRLRNKSLLTVVVSLAFLGGYYYVWFQANHLLQMLIINSMTVGAKIKGAVYPLYLLGRVGEGDIVSALLCAAVLFAAAALVYRILSYNFVKMTASSSGKQHTRYREKRLRRKSCMGALLTREVRRFLSSSTYMLNCSLGTLFLVAASVFLLVKGNWILGALWQFFEADMKMVFLIGCVGVCGLAAMNDITAPSVSLEGKNLWILQSLPIASWDVLKVKLYLHLLLTGIPAILCTVCMAVVFRFSLLMASAAILMVFLFTLLPVDGSTLFLDILLVKDKRNEDFGKFVKKCGSGGMRKRRLIRTIIIAAFCAVIFSVIVMIWMKKDAEEYKKWQAQYRGTWVSPDGQYKMTVQRVTSAHIIFSVTNKDNLSLNYASATAVGDGEYSFAYKLQRGMDGSVTARFGNTGKGVIRLKEKSLSLDVPKLEKFEEGLQFRGALKKKSGLPDIKKKELLALMGKDKPQGKKAEKTLYIAEAQEGKVERVHINWDAASDRKGYEGYEMSGINPVCMVSDLQAQFGDPAAEEELSENRYKRVYRKDGYQYWFITDGYGLVTEGDCQYEKPKRGRRDGDFIREGDTILRYLGDYEKSRTVTLPQGTKKIASGAFTVTPDTVQQKYVKSLKLSIPSGIEIERNAFENCSSMQITLEEGWTSVPEEAFAHMVGAGGLRGKAGWVKVNLPHSLRRLEAKAFETNWFEGGEAYTEEDTMGGVLEIGVQPVTVLLNEELEYIGDNALYGICNTMLPKKVKYIGANFTLLPSVAFWNASDVKVQKPDGFYSWEYCYNIALPEQLEYVSEKGFYFWTPEFSMRAIDGNFTVLQIPENAKNVPCLSNILVIQYSVNEKNNKYSSKDGWLFSRDGKKLYRTTSEIDFSKKQKGREVTFKKISKGTYKTYVRIKEGIEEIASQAFASIVNRSADILDVQFITPNSLKCIDRGALFENRSYFDTWDDSVTSVKIAGEVPQFTGDISPDSAYKRKVYVKKQYREKFIKELFEGQQLSDKQKNQIKKCIIGY